VVRPECNVDVLAGRELALAPEVAPLEGRPFLRVELRLFFLLLRLLIWRLRGGPSESSSWRAVFLAAVASFERLPRPDVDICGGRSPSVSLMHLVIC
jgi:hypothetical protein